MGIDSTVTPRMSSQLVPTVLTRRIITSPQPWHLATSPGACV